MTANIRLGPDPLRDHMTKVCDPATCGYCAKRRRIEAEERAAALTCPNAPEHDPGHCSHWENCEPCCRCGDDTIDPECDCPRCTVENGSSTRAEA